MSDDINTSMQRERLAGAAAKSEQPTSDTPRIEYHQIACSICAGEKKTLCGEPCICVDGTEEGEIRGLRLQAIKLSEALAAAKAEQSESTARIAGLQARVDQYQQERSDAIDDLAAAKAENATARTNQHETEKALVTLREALNAAERENAELRKRPTMEEVQAYCKAWYSGLRHQVCNNDHYGLAAFIEQQRRKEG